MYLIGAICMQFLQLAHNNLLIMYLHIPYTLKMKKTYTVMMRIKVTDLIWMAVGCCQYWGQIGLAGQDVKVQLRRCRRDFGLGEDGLKLLSLGSLVPWAHFYKDPVFRRLL